MAYVVVYEVAHVVCMAIGVCVYIGMCIYVSVETCVTVVCYVFIEEHGLSM